MKKFTLALVFAVAALATAGQVRHGANPLTLSGKAWPVTSDLLPLPIPECPPCAMDR